MFIRLALSFCWVLLTGFLLITIFLKNEEDFEDIGLRIWLGIGAGFGLASGNFFLWRLVTVPQNHAFLWGEILILICVLVVYFAKLQPHKCLNIIPQKIRLSKPSYLEILFLTITGIAVGIHLIGFLKSPQGAWDAWAIWNQHARLLIQDSELWVRVFSPLQQHPDYPMMLPANVARAWIYMGKESPFAPALIGATFTFSILGLLVTCISRLRQPKLGLLAGILLMGAPAFHVSGLAQYADFPLAYFILAVLVLFNIYKKHPTKIRQLILAGTFAGFCAWTKNEGWLFIVVLIVARILEDIFHTQNYQILWKEAIAFLIGISPILVLLIYYHVVFTPTNDLIAGQGATTLERILEPIRHIMIIKSFLSQIYRLDTKYAVPFIILPLLLIIMGIKKENLHQNGFLTTFLVPILMIVGYYLIFLTTPQKLTWHLGTARERLFFHVWPVSILATFLVIPVLSSSIRKNISKEPK